MMTTKPEMVCEEEKLHSKPHRSRSKRDMPVLFHLMDVSPAKSPTPTIELEAEIDPPVAVVEPAAEPIAQVVCPSAEQAVTPSSAILAAAEVESLLASAEYTPPADAVPTDAPSTDAPPQIVAETSEPTAPDSIADAVPDVEIEPSAEAQPAPVVDEHVAAEVTEHALAEVTAPAELAAKDEKPDASEESVLEATAPTSAELKAQILQLEAATRAILASTNVADEDSETADEALTAATNDSSTTATAETTETSETSSAATDIAATPPAAEAAEKVTPLTARERAAMREQKRQSLSGDSWLRRHSKLVVIGFIVALGVTVVVARVTRKPAKEVAGPVVEWPTEHPGLAADPHALEIAEASDASSNIAATGLKPSANGMTADISPAQLPKRNAGKAEDVYSTAQAEIMAPTVPASEAVAENAPASTPAASGKAELFPWGKQEDARLASRPNAVIENTTITGGQSPAAPSAGNPPAGYPSTGAMGGPIAPAMNDPAPNAASYRYPQTNYQGLSVPASGPATAYPQGPLPAQPGMPVPPDMTAQPSMPAQSYMPVQPDMNAQPYLPVQPPMNGQPPQYGPAPSPGQPAVGGGAYVPANYPVTTPPAGGYRNEPHGSGLY